MKVSVYLGKIMIISIYAPNNKVSKYMKQAKTDTIKGEVGYSTVISEDFSTSLSEVKRQTRVKIK